MACRELATASTVLAVVPLMMASQTRFSFRILARLASSASGESECRAKTDTNKQYVVDQLKTIRRRTKVLGQSEIEAQMPEQRPDTSNAAIGGRLVAVRMARGLNQAAMAKAIGESPQRWGGYERGRVLPPPGMLAKFWQLTGATSDYVLFGRVAGLPVELALALERVAPLPPTKAVGSGQRLR